MSGFSIADVVMSPPLPTCLVGAGNQMVTPASAAPLMTMLGDYELHHEIGRGGMGIVYEATQISLRRNVAIKTLPFAAVLDQQQVARFRNEAQAAASLHHPHIVPVYAVGCERGVHYYSMQLIDGDTLERTLSALHANAAEQQRAEKLSELRRDEANRAAAELTAEMQVGDQRSLDNTGPGADASGTFAADAFTGQATSRVVKDQGSTVHSVRDRQTIRSIVQLFVNVADALDYAHQQGVIHRDIKPSNLLIDGSGKIWIADFGLARCRGIGNLTAEGSVLGTARYMSPEQLAGRTQAVDHRTDIYSLGITLYEMLTLQPAFSAPNRQQLMRAVESDQPASPRALNPKIETDLETIVLKAIAKSKDERYDTAGDFADDLRRYLDGMPTLARRPGKIDLAFRWALRHRRMVLVSLVIMASAIAGLSVATVLVSRQTRIAVAQMEIADREVNAILSFFDCFGGLSIKMASSLPGGKEELREILMKIRPYAAEFRGHADKNPTYRIVGTKLHFFLGQVNEELGNFDEAEQEYRLAVKDFESLEQAEKNNPTIMSEHAECLHILAQLRKQTGHYQDARALYGEASVLQENVIAINVGDNHAVIKWAKTQANLAKLEWECGDCQDATHRMRVTVSDLKRCSGDHPDQLHLRSTLIESRNTLAGLISNQKPASAEKLFRQNILQLNKWLQDSPAVDSSKAADAVAMTRDLALLPPICQLSVAQNNLAELLGRSGEFAEALDLTAAAIEICERANVTTQHVGAMQRQLATALNNRGQLLFARQADGDAEQSELAFRQSERLFREIIVTAADDPHLYSRLAGVLHNMSVIKQQRGELDMAVRDLTGAVEMQRLAVRKAPLNQGFRAYLKLHTDLRKQLLQEIDPSPNSSDHACGRSNLPVRRECRDIASSFCVTELGAALRNQVFVQRTFVGWIGDHMEVGLDV